MVDPFSVVAGGVTIVQGVAAFHKYLHSQGDHVISAYFDAHGEQLEGDAELRVNVHMDENDAVWWFEVNPIENYVFIRAPVIETSVIEIPGQVKGAKNPDTNYWRWIGPSLPGVIMGGNSSPPNILVNFVVVGYRPAELLSRSEAG
jgi:hypothetical protein